VRALRETTTQDAASEHSASEIDPLLDQVLEQIAAFDSRDLRWREFDEAPTVRDALVAIFGKVVDGDVFAVTQVLNRLIADIDSLANAQINVLLHHPDFQALEATWRGVRYLVDSIDPDLEGDARIRIWNCSRRELARDMERAVEFDQSQVFQKVYSEEFGTAGGTPYGLLIADYQFSNHPEDVELLGKLAQVGAASFAPCVAGAGPGLFEMDSFASLDRITSLDATFDRASYVKWRALRDSDDARFLSLVMPRILMRPPYPDTSLRADGFVFREQLTPDPQRNYVWGNAAFALGDVAIRAYQSMGWLAAIRGVQPGRTAGGVAQPPGVHWFETDSPGVAPRCCTEVVVTEHQDRMLSDAGIMPLCDLPGTGHAAFYSTRSVQQPRKYDTAEATQNAKMSSMFQYMLCVSQFARYLKVIGRDFIGAFTGVEELQKYLSDWLVKYVSLDDDAPPTTKARYPLRQGRVQMRPHPGRPGAYLCSMHLQPHYELDDMSASVQLSTELSSQRQ